MVQPIPIYRRTLTGRVRLRRGWFGRVIAQVEVRAVQVAFWEPERETGTPFFQWRDAVQDDLPKPVFGNAVEVSS